MAEPRNIGEVMISGLQSPSGSVYLTKDQNDRLNQVIDTLKESSDLLGQALNRLNAAGDEGAVSTVAKLGIFNSIAGLQLLNIRNAAVIKADPLRITLPTQES